MNYAGTFDAARFPDGPGISAHGNVDGAVRFSAPPAHAPADAIVLPDAHFLFNSDFKRSGADLILSADGHELVLHDYFKGEKRAPLASPDGAHLTGDLVNALTGSVEVSQADGTAPAGKVIGHVTKLVGTATAIRNGVSIILHQGDNVEKGDVVQSGSDSTLGISFIDGTVFGLSSNARMVLNEMVYDPNGSSNSSLLSLVAGTISFVAGETAKHGDMKVDTPVATMGIRGTAVLVEIDFNVPGQGGTPSAKFQVLVEPDGRTGSYVLLDKGTLQPLAVVDQAGHQVSIQNGVISQTDTGLPPDVQKLINDVFTLKFTDNTNPKSTTHFTDLGVIETTPLQFANANGITAVANFLIINPPDTTPPLQLGPLPFHIPGPPSVVVLDESRTPTTHFSLSELAGKTGDVVDADVVTGKISFADPNGGDRPSASAKFKSFAYQDAQHHDVSASLSALQLKDIAATEINIAVKQDSSHLNFGTASWSYSIADHAFDFLAAGETLTLTYVLRVDNNFDQGNEFTEVPITITVTGTNDAPVITTNAQSIAFSGGTSTPGGPLTSDDPTKGSLSFADADLTDSHTVSAKLSSAVLEDGGHLPPAPLALLEHALSVSLASDSTGTGIGTVDWSLANLPAYVADFIPKGQTLTLTYAVTVTDSQGATSEQTVTVTITGTDAPAEVWIATTSGTSGEAHAGSVLLWRDGANWETGLAPTAKDDVIIITDQLHGLTPAFPVTVDQAAAAKSVTMNDFGGGGTPELDNLSTLAILGALTLQVDSIVHNAGTMSVGGLANVLDHSVLDNSGALTLKGGGEFGAKTSITNTGAMELAAGTLNVAADVVNSGGKSTIQVDANAKLVLAAGAITGGSIKVAGTLELDSGSVLSHGTLANSGTLTMSGSGNALHDETVTANHALNILADGALALDLGTSFDNCNGTITVNHGATLSLNDASIYGGQITNAGGGTLALTGLASLIGGQLGNFGDVSVKATGNVLDSETVTNDTAATITIALGAALALTDTAIAGGIVHNSGEIDVIGDSTLDGSMVDGGGIVVGTPWQDGPGDWTLENVAYGDSGPPPVTLTLQNGVTITNTDLTIEPYGALDVSTAGGATLSGVSITSDYGAVGVEKGSVLVLEHSTISGGGLFNAGTVHVETALATTFDGVYVDNGATGVIVVDDDGGQPVPSTLVLDGDTTVTGGTLCIGMVGLLEIHGSDVTLSDTHVDNGGTFTVDVDAILDLANTCVTGDGTFHVSGALDASGFCAISGAVINDGTIEVTSGILDIGGAITGTGSITIDAGAALELGGADALVVTFDGDGSSELVLDAGASVGAIKGLGISDKLDLGAISFDANPTASYDAESGMLTVSDSEHHTVSLTLKGADYSHAHFASSSDGHGGTLITLNAADDAPQVTDANAQSGTINELPDTKGSSLIDSTGGTIHFSDVDLTDRPVAMMSTPTLTWTAADHTDMTASLTPAQITALEQALTIQQSDSTNNGSVDWSYKIADGALDFLGADQVLTVKATVTIDDQQGGTVDVPVTVTIHGAEDNPVILAETNPDVQTVVLARAPTVLAAGTTTNTAGLATETFDEQQAGSAANNGHGHGDFYSTTLHARFDGDGNAGVVHGSSSSISAAPYVGDGGQDDSNYLSVGAHAHETITFDHQQNSFGLYWGSVDSYNSIDFYNGDKLVASYSGSDIAPLLASGGQGSFASNGYVEFLDLAPFTKVVLASSQNAFELDNVSAGNLDDSPVKLAHTVGGTLTVTDQDIGDTLTASVVGGAAVKYNGSSHLPTGVDVNALVDAGAIKFDSAISDGKADLLHWSYDPTDASLDFLEPGDTLTLTYQAKVSDGHGNFGLQPLTISIAGNGSPIVFGTAQDDTFDHVGGGAAIFGLGGIDNFVFNPHFGSAIIADFNVNKDVLELDHSLFGPSAQDVLNSAHAANSNHDAVLIDAAHETITLKGVTLAQLNAHQNDFHIV